MTLEDVEKVVNQVSGIDINDDTHKNYIVHCRWIFFDLCKKFIKDVQYSEMGKYVGRDHAAVSHALNNKGGEYSRLEIRLKESEELRGVYNKSICVLSKNIKINLEEINDLRAMKLFHKSEMLRLVSDFDKNITETEIKLINRYENLSNCINKNTFIKELLSLPEEQIYNFEITRVKPYLIMNKHLNNG